MAEREDVRWGQAQRFEFIEWRAYWLGRVNRSDLTEKFRVSTPQASIDLQAYQEAAPNNLKYDQTEKAYVLGERFQPRFLRVSADRYLMQLNAIHNYAIQVSDTWFGSPPPVSVMPTIVRSVEPETLRQILRAVDRRLELQVEYQSLTNSRTRAIAPHSLAFDGHRWHARAWCVEHRDFRDFVLTRILSVGEAAPSNARSSDDMEWDTFVELKVVAHPSLDDAQRSAIEHDYGMHGGQLIVRTRAALAFYLIKRMNLDLASDAIPAERKQIFLTNLPEIERTIASARQQTLTKVSAQATAAQS